MFSKNVLNNLELSFIMIIFTL